MRGALGMVLGLGVGIVGFIIALKSEDGGNAWVGVLSGLAGVAGCAWAYPCYERRLEQEQRGECLFSFAQGTFMGYAIPLWLVMCAGVAILCLLRALGILK